MNESLDYTFDETFSYRLIYIYAIDDARHEGLLKIGEATISTELAPENLAPNSKPLNQAAKVRIGRQTTTAGIQPRLLHTELALRHEKSSKNQFTMEIFSDHRVHDLLKNSGYPPYRWKGCTSREWFQIDLQTALKAIQAVKKHLPNLSNVPSAEIRTAVSFRPEQEDAISQTVKRFQVGDRFLWNAKMRFGKTLCALEVVRQMNFEKTIIITHRPVVDEGWYTDFQKIFFREEDSHWLYGSKGHGTTLQELRRKKAHFIYFASIQDLRGSKLVGGNFDKNNEVFKLDWDCVIIDESHEGTTTDLGTKVRDLLTVKKKGHVPKLLELSGTPFNRVAEFTEPETYTWDYVMEQRAKANWDKEHDCDSNPYADLPEMRIYTYDLGKILHSEKYAELTDKAFNFTEFFRVDPVTETFIHEKDVRDFLDLISTESATSLYPYATKEFRDLFKHTFWVVPGVREAKALKALMESHPIFGCGAFKIVNVAGKGDDDEVTEEALQNVRNRIREAGEDGYTITISCGRLTTGVTIPEWTAVLMLSGTSSTSASSYLQTIFRVQSPCSRFGKMKEKCYVFDFAPDRTLKMISEAVKISSKPGKATEAAKARLGEFLNFCPVISIQGTVMKRYDTPKLLRELKRVYIERVVTQGFDTKDLYSDQLLKLSEEDLKNFDKLKGIIGASKAAPSMRDVNINNQGFTEEEYEETEDIQKKPKKTLTPEEKARLEELKKKKEQKQNAISILRGISIRMPLLIYGAQAPIDEDITLRGFVKMIDQASWDEFMPQGVDKNLFMKFIHCYDEEIFIAAGKRIRETVRSADKLPPLERIEVITRLFSCFKNPDKETVLTPWRVVNMHLGDTLGGWCFFDEKREPLDKPRWVSRGEVTDQTFGNPDARILEINSKTGLYPLYAAYSLFRTRCGRDHTAERRVWLETVENNIFVICKTPMAVNITRRTLIGYQDGNVNAHHFNDLVGMLKEKPKLFTDKVNRGAYWGMKGVKEMKFDAIVGNPPYQVNDGGNNASATPLYHLFVEQSVKLDPRYISMIMPSRWYSGGRGLDKFRADMIADTRLKELYDYLTAEEVFPGVDISGGICYFLWDRGYEGPCRVTNMECPEKTASRYLNKYPILIRSNEAISILEKAYTPETETIERFVSSQKPFGLRTYARPEETGDLTLRWNGGKGPFPSSQITVGTELIDKYKVIVSRVFFEHAGKVDKNGQRRVFSILEILQPKEICSETYIVVKSFDEKNEAENFYKYLSTKFVRFLILQATSSIMITRSSFVFVPLQDFTHTWTDTELYAKYHLTQSEIDVIESTIRVMD